MESGELRHDQRKGIFSIEHIMWLSTFDCYYCGNPPLNTIKYNGGLLGFYNGLDRVDNSIRIYTPENTVTCCVLCNIAKRDREINQFLAWADKINQQIKSNPLLQYLMKQDRGETSAFLQRTPELMERIIWHDVR